VVTRRSPTIAHSYAAVVIGGSAGGIDALQTILPRQTAQIAWVVVLHQLAGVRSLLPAVFGHVCALPVREVVDKHTVEPGVVYFAPPDYHLFVERGGSFALSVDPPVNYSRPSIDVLFESAADVYAESVVAVLLSGANTDGARGAHAIHNAGGLVMVQTPDSATSPQMPQAALRLFRPDFVGTPPQLAEQLRSVTGAHS
jgi:two-component system chemotaxis response regulator CheB